MESKKYKIRLIIMCIILLISTVLGVISEKQAKKNADQIDKIVSTIQSIPAEEYEAGAKDENLSAYDKKEQALEVMQKMQAEYTEIFKYPENYVIIIFIFAITGSIIGIMMYFIFSGWLIKKAFPDLKLWMSIIMQILALILLIKILFYILITIGVLGQIPFIIYTIYKFIKLKREENKNDIIKDKN